MRWVLSGALCLGLMSCGWSETRFIDEYVQEECAHLMECHDPAVLTFLGWDTVEDCIDDRGPEVTTTAAGCEYDKRSAKKCVKAFEDLSCPADGEQPTVPAECEHVFQFCDDDDQDSGT